MVAPVAVTFVVLQAVLWIGAVVGAPARRARGPAASVALAALAMLAYLPGHLPGRPDRLPRRAGRAPTGCSWSGLAVALAVARDGGRAAGALDPLLLCLGVVFGLLVVDMLIGAPLQLNTVFGYSPTVGGRFAGMGNLAYGQFAGAAFLLVRAAVAPARRPQRRHGRRPSACSCWPIVIDGMPIWGSDVGGVLAFVPAVGVTAAVLLGHRVRWRSVAVWGSLAVAGGRRCSRRST